MTIEVRVCVGDQFAGQGEFGAATDLGPMDIIPVDPSRCRAARSGEVRVNLSAPAANGDEAVSLTRATDASGRISFDVPILRTQRVVTLRLQTPFTASPAGVRMLPGRVVVMPLTVIVAGPTASMSGNAGFSDVSGPAVGQAAASADRRRVPVSGASRRWLKPGRASRRGMRSVRVGANRRR